MVDISPSVLNSSFNFRKERNDRLTHSLSGSLSSDLCDNGRLSGRRHRGEKASQRRQVENSPNLPKDVSQISKKNTLEDRLRKVNSRSMRGKRNGCRSVKSMPTRMNHATIIDRSCNSTRSVKTTPGSNRYLGRSQSVHSIGGGRRDYDIDTVEAIDAFQFERRKRLVMRAQMENSPQLMSSELIRQEKNIQQEQQTVKSQFLIQERQEKKHEKRPQLKKSTTFGATKANQHEKRPQLKKSISLQTDTKATQHERRRQLRKSLSLSFSNRNRKNSSKTTKKKGDTKDGAGSPKRKNGGRILNRSNSKRNLSGRDLRSFDAELYGMTTANLSQSESQHLAIIQKEEAHWLQRNQPQHIKDQIVYQRRKEQKEKKQNKQRQQLKQKQVRQREQNQRKEHRGQRQRQKSQREYGEDEPDKREIEVEREESKDYNRDVCKGEIDREGGEYDEYDQVKEAVQDLLASVDSLNRICNSIDSQESNGKYIPSKFVVVEQSTVVKNDQERPTPNDQYTPILEDRQIVPWKHGKDEEDQQKSAQNFDDVEKAVGETLLYVKKLNKLCNAIDSKKAGVDYYPTNFVVVEQSTIGKEKQVQLEPHYHESTQRVPSSQSDEIFEGQSIETEYQSSSSSLCDKEEPAPLEFNPNQSRRVSPRQSSETVEENREQKCSKILRGEYTEQGKKKTMHKLAMSKMNSLKSMITSGKKPRQLETRNQKKDSEKSRNQSNRKHSDAITKSRKNEKHGTRRTQERQDYHSSKSCPDLKPRLNEMRLARANSAYGSITNVDASNRSFYSDRCRDASKDAIFERNENLLLEVFPRHVAERLRDGRKVEPEERACATVIFADIVNYTKLCSMLTPMQISNMLNRLYSKYDELAKAYGVFKIETIGDAYMAVTNLHIDQTDIHVRLAAYFAIDIVRASNEIRVDLKDESKGCVQVRVGFHSGPIVANVVGTRLPKYTIFGDAVNVAARMEENSLPGRIQCSNDSAKLLMVQGPEIPLSFRGKIDVKGKTKLDTYWVNEE